MAISTNLKIEGRIDWRDRIHICEYWRSVQQDAVHRRSLHEIQCFQFNLHTDVEFCWCHELRYVKVIAQYPLICHRKLVLKNVAQHSQMCEMNATHSHKIIFVRVFPVECMQLCNEHRRNEITRTQLMKFEWNLDDITKRNIATAARTVKFISIFDVQWFVFAFRQIIDCGDTDLFPQANVDGKNNTWANEQDNKEPCHMLFTLSDDRIRRIRSKKI